ncbi:MAG TPA: hypothetical protein VJ911_00540 [Cryomorphaceae bacterium]|nr:hypothetical protein [Cryomorphaceae bacterium]
MKYLFWRRSFIALLVFVGVELSLRIVGFGNIPVYYVSNQYEYALEPNQHMTRFGNTIHINAAGMRSDGLKMGEKRILKFGDSVLHGGVATDQSELSSQLLENELKLQQPNVRVLNVSAGSWGPDNAFAWMQKHSDFNAIAVVLVFGSHDWQDQMTFRKVVGRVPFYPDSKPALAISDCAQWLYSRWFSEVNWDELEENKDANYKRGKFNRGWQQFIDYCNRKNLPLLVYHHANMEEVENKSWSKKGARLEAFLAENNVAVISGLKSGMDKDDFRDKIHLNPSGQRKLADALGPTLQEFLAISNAE